MKLQVKVEHVPEIGATINKDGKVVGSVIGYDAETCIMHIEIEDSHSVEIKSMINPIGIVSYSSKLI